MTHPNLNTNGASLEDCHTNFFALADLSGIKWSRLTTADGLTPGFSNNPNSGGSGGGTSSSSSNPKDPLDDPVLTCYGKCLNSGELLCAWTRVIKSPSSASSALDSLLGPTATTPINKNCPDGSVQFSKELWIFWYSKKPDLSEYISNDLTEIEQGSWENGLSYECRTILFKAFHNLIERCLLSKGFARFGRWFTHPSLHQPSQSTHHGSSASSSTQSSSFASGDKKHQSQNNHHNGVFSPSSPVSGSNNSDGGSQISFAFDYFVHGDSTVCASLDIRHHPSIYRLNRSHLNLAQASQNGIRVILSPYGMEGIMTGQSFKESDASVQRLLSDWKKFYPLNQSPKDVANLNQNNSSGRSSSMNSYDETSKGSNGTSPAAAVASNSGPSSGTSSSSVFPPVVEVIVAGVKMKYPSSYTYVTPDFHNSSSSHVLNGCSEKTDSSSRKKEGATATPTPVGTTTPSTGVTNTTQINNQQNNSSNYLMTVSNTHNNNHTSSGGTSNKLSQPLISPRQTLRPSSCFKIRSRCHQDMGVAVDKSILSSPKKITSITGDNSNNREELSSPVVSSSPSGWDFVDPCSKVSCNCSRCKSSPKKNSGPNKSGPLSSKTSSGNNKNDKNSEKNGQQNNSNNDKGSTGGVAVKSSPAKPSQPFHKRSTVAVSSGPVVDHQVIWKQQTAASGVNQTETGSNGQMAGGGTTSCPSVQSTSSCTPQPKTPCYTYKSPGASGLASIQSNAATTPGGLDSPRSVGPSVGSVGGLPSVSPHPSKDQTDSQADSILSSSDPSPAGCPVSNQPKSQLEQLLSPSLNSNGPFGKMTPTPGGLDGIKRESDLMADVKKEDMSGGMKRPALSMMGGSEDRLDMMMGKNTSHSLLYNFSCLSTTTGWDLPPPKRRRVMGSSSNHHSLEENGCSSVDLFNSIDPRDPYEFDEDTDSFGQDSSHQNSRSSNSNQLLSAALTNGCMTGGSSSSLSVYQQQNSQNDHHQTSSDLTGIPPSAMDYISTNSPMTPASANLFTKEKELIPNPKDLDHMFETSSSSDESNSSPQPAVGVNNNNSNNNNRRNETGPHAAACTPQDLCKMFPTPPSLEPNLASSPSMTLALESLIDPNEDPLDLLESLKDLSYVYKPPVSYIFPAPSKYAALTNIKSISLQLSASLIYKRDMMNPMTGDRKEVLTTSNTSNILTVNNQQQQQLVHPKQQNHHPLKTNMSSLNPPGYIHVSQLPSGPQGYNPRGGYPPGGHYPPGSRFSGPHGPHPNQSHHLQQNSRHPFNAGSSGPPGVNQYSTHGPNGSNPNGVNMFSLHHPQHVSGVASGDHTPHHQQMFSPYSNHNSPRSVMGPNTPMGHSGLGPYDSHDGSGMRHRIQGSELSVTHGAVSSSVAGSGVNQLMDQSEVSSILVVLALSDSILNLHKDHNFETCTICVCNMNVKGSDVGIYLPESLFPGSADDNSYKCTCGFSAVVNRNRSLNAGLFYEDEVEVTGLYYDPTEGTNTKSLLSITHATSTTSTSSGANSTTVKQEASGNTSCNKENMTSSTADLIHGSTMIDTLRVQSSYSLSSLSMFTKSFYLDSLTGDNWVKKESDDSLSQLTKYGSSSKIISRHVMLEKNNLISRSDSNEITLMTLMSGKSALETMSTKLSAASLLILSAAERRAKSSSCLHEWQFSLGKIPKNNQVVVRFLKNLQPMLQESVQKKPKPNSWETTYRVSGPLTWRQFHELAGRGTEDQCEPQPIPSLLVGHNKDWLGVSPYALKYWDKLMLEPYSVTRDVAYLVVAPDNHNILSQVRSFFRELSTMYETLRLGRHCPMTKGLRDGIVRAGKGRAGDEPIDEWFSQITDSDVSTKLKMYAQACKAYIVSIIRDQASDRSIFEHSKSSSSSSSSSNNNNNQSSSGNPNTPGSNKPTGASPMNPDSVKQQETEGSKDNEPSEGASHNMNSSSIEEQDDETNRQAAIVVYIVEPFTSGNLDDETYRLSCLGLLRCFAQIFRSLPELQNHLNLQIVSLDTITGGGLDMRDSSRVDSFKSLCLSVFGQCRKTLSPAPICKSLTGFGPAASIESFLKKSRGDSISSNSSNNFHSNRFYAPPYILAPLKDKQTELGEMFGDRKEKSQTLYCCYCLTENQKMLIVSCSNGKGDILESTVINVEVPNRIRRRKASVKKFGLNKVMEFIISVMSECLEPWRLVVGRLGRLGHGELREWASLLSKRALLKATARLKDKCEQCTTLSYYELPSILSACLISIEADTTLRVFPDQIKLDDKFKTASCPLNTPEDASSTHLLIFPTSATTQSSHEPPTLGEDDLLVALGAGGGADDLGLGEDDPMNDLFGANLWGDDPPSPGAMGNDTHGNGSGHPDSPGSRQTGFGDGSLNHKGSSGLNDMSDEPLQLLQQPLALGYYVSTAQTGPLPQWFWSSCPHLKDVSPTFLRSALLIHTPSVHQHNDDLLHTSNRNCHPLDSNLTTDVLRYVLEGYNSLSWLSLDPTSHDRTSCLPIHIQSLMQLYTIVQTLS